MEETKQTDGKILKALKKIKAGIGLVPDLGMILGSGLGELVDEFEDAFSISFGDIPNFPVSSVKGHRGELVIGRFRSKTVAALSGRVHYYEGYSMQEVTFPVRVMAGLGIKKLIVTNAGGAVNESFAPGDIIILEDHINMMGSNPLRGSSSFTDMTSAYDPSMVRIAEESAGKAGVAVKKGVYLAMSGPSYETPHEIKMARLVGADIVGMSTVPEVIVANMLGVKVLGLSVITNMGAGILKTPLNHEEVIEVTRKISVKFRSLVREIAANL
ncbi:MAG: purine-nucleoside phosphorylase [Elusimicrobia bacterium]|nr:purine-nucleoside phosphorylase [Elusimicrobiota bacterium]